MQVQNINITGLSPYQLITVTITATNGAGTSEPSNKVLGRTHEAGIHTYVYARICMYMYLLTPPQFLE